MEFCRECKTTKNIHKIQCTMIKDYENQQKYFCDSCEFERYIGFVRANFEGLKKHWNHEINRLNPDVSEEFSGPIASCSRILRKII